MKYVRVLLVEDQGRPAGTILDVVPQKTGVRAGLIQEVEVADDFDPSIYVAVLGEPISSEGMNPELEITFTENAAAVAAKAAKAKQVLIGQKYTEMDTAIFDEMVLVFGTRRADSAAASERTLQLMKEKPELFASEGLKVMVAAPGFAVGSDLNTETKVVNYATARLARIEEYGVFRLKKMQWFAEQKALIEAQ